jgi:hypothetical protein
MGNLAQSLRGRAEMASNFLHQIRPTTEKKNATDFTDGTDGEFFNLRRW